MTGISHSYVHQDMYNTRNCQAGQKRTEIENEYHTGSQCSLEPNR